MFLFKLLEIGALAIVLDRRSDMMTADVAKTLYFSRNHDEFRGPMEDIRRNEFRLGAVRVSPLEGWIEGATGIRHVQPKVMDVLLCLASRSGEVVERDTILDEVWDGRPTTDDVLTRCISELRNVLGDQAENPAYIQTIPKRGYRLIPQVVVSHSGDVDAGTESIGTLQKLWEDLKQRKVVRVAIAYAAMSWLLLQVAQVLVDALSLPDWALPAFLFALGVGFLIAVVVAWLYQLVPEHDAEEYVPRRRLKQSIDAAIIAFLAIFVGLLAYRQFIDQPMFPSVDSLPETLVAPQPSDRSIAVLRFASFGGDTVFSNGLGEHLLNLLARAGELQVPSRQVTWGLSDQNMDPVKIASVLRVKYILEGSVQQREERIRVTAQLIDGASGNHVWSESYDDTLSADNFFNIQDAIAQQVVAKLETTLASNGESSTARRGTEKDEALLAYLAGRESLRESKTEESMSAAVSAFESAIEADPHFAEAHAGLCEAQLAWYVTLRDTAYFQAAEAACIRALRINRNLGEVYAALGSLHRYGGQLDEAEAELLEARNLLNDPAIVLEELGRTYRAQSKLVLAEQTFNEAIVKDPANWSVYKSMANFLLRTGRYTEALPYYKQVVVMRKDDPIALSNIGAAFFMLGDFHNSSLAWGESLALDPTHFAFMNLANSLFYQGKFEESVAMYWSAIELGANDARVWGSLGASCAQVVGEEQCVSEAYTRAIELNTDILAINPLDTTALSRLATYYSRLQMIAQARQSLIKLLDLSWDDPDVSYFIALAQVSLGETSEAITSLNNAIIMGYPRVLIAADPGFTALRGDPEFIRITENGLN